MSLGVLSVDRDEDMRPEAPIDPSATPFPSAGREGILAQALQASSDAIAISRLEDGCLLEVNDACLRMIGYAREEVIGRSFMELGVWADPADRTRLIHALEHDEALDPIQVSIRSKSGEVRLVELAAQLIEMGGSQFIFALGRDITDRRRLEGQLRASEEQYRALAETSPDAVVVADLDLRITVVNEQAVELYGASGPDALIGRSVFDLVAPEDWNLATEGAGQTFETGSLRGLRLTLVKRDGSRYQGEVSASLIRGVDGKPVALLGVVRDITERLLVERELRLTHDVALSIGAAATVDEGIQVALREICERTGWVFGQAWRRSGEGSPLELSATYVLRQERHPDGDGGYRALASADALTSVVSTHRPEWWPDPSAMDGVSRRNAALDLGLAAGLAIPVMAGGDVVAVLEFFLRHQREEDRRFLDVVSTVASQVGSLIRRKAAEEELRKSQNLYRLVLENSLDLITVLDPGGRILYASPSHRRILGYSHGDLLQLPMVDLVHVDDRPAFEEAIGQMLSGVQALIPSLRMRDSDGYWLFVESQGVAIFDDRGRPEMLLVGSRDLTERRRSEEHLRLAEHRYRTLVEQVPAITYTDAVDDRMTTLYISPQVESILGYTPAQWTGSTQFWFDHMDPRDRDRAMADYRRARDTGQSFETEYRMRASDGRLVWLRDSGVIVRGPEGAAALIHGILSDITEVKRAEQELERALSIEREAAQRLRMLDEMKNMFLRAASHELRTPITISRGHLEVLGPHPQPSEVKEAIGVVVDELARMGRIVDDITTLVRMDDPSFLRLQPVDLGTFLSEVRTKARPLLGDRLRYRPISGGSVQADPQRLTQALVNLLQNAAMHTKGTKVEFGVEEEPRMWRFEVSDSGEGLPAGAEERLFQPFQRADTSGAGSGLGLAIVRGIAAAHGGSAGVENRPGEGATFWIRIPR
ncbi:hypothetical protein BH20ACT24_BH20ACT24_11910 [soil metagenome]